MGEIIAFMSLMTFLTALVVTGRPLYLLSLRLYTMLKTKHLSINLDDLHYSFEQMVYFVTLPSHLPYVMKATKDDLMIEIEYDGWIFPVLKGIRIILKSDGERYVISYLSIEQFRIPLLDQLEQQGKINSDTYHKISTCKLLEKTTLQNVLEEVFRQLRVGHYSY